MELKDDTLKQLIDIANGETIYVNYHGNPEIQQLPQGDWIDLATIEDIELRPNEFQLISFGISMQLPENYEAIIAPRSSTFKKWGIIQVNSIGVIDNSYCGDDDIWMMPVLATKYITIPAGTRIAQFRIQKKQPIITLISVDSLGNKSRGGFGSTGEKLAQMLF